jgi:predicted nucleic acid-binding Zn ribbon protein
MYCISCGTKIIEGSKFCTGCGQTLSVIAEFRKKPDSNPVLIIKIIILIALVAVLFITLPVYIRNDGNLISSEAGALSKYLLVLTSIISVLAQVYLIFILIRRWDIKSIFKRS